MCEWGERVCVSGERVSGRRERERESVSGGGERVWSG